MRTFGPGEYYYDVAKPTFPVQPGHEWVRTQEVSSVTVRDGVIETPKWRVEPIAMVEATVSEFPWSLVIAGAFAALFFLATNKKERKRR